MLGGLLATPLLAACAGFDTSGAAAPGTVGFLSTQFTPVEERQRFEQVLRSQLPVPVAYNPVEGGVFTTTIKSQAQARNVRTALIGGLYNDLAPLADAFDDVGGILGRLSDAGYPDQILKLTTLGGATPKFVPWMQATYIVAVNKQALQWLPAGADVRELTYDQYLAWARAAQAAAGRPVFGIPAGPKGLFYRFTQGYLLPSFTGGQVTTFRSADADVAWDRHGRPLGGRGPGVHQLRIHAGAAGPRRGAGGVGPRGPARRRHEGQAGRLADGARTARAEGPAATCSSSRGSRCPRAAWSARPPSR